MAESGTDAARSRFQILVLPHLERLLAFAGRRLGNRADAEDAVQEACARAWLGFEGLRDDANVRSWLYRILRSVMNDLHDKQGRREQLLPLLQLEPYLEEALGPDDAGPLEQLLHAVSSDRVREALRMIPEEFATALELHDIDGFRYREIADIIDIPLGTVMSRIHRGRRMLAVIILAHAANWDLPERPLRAPLRFITKRNE